ncbi:hypothetical protein Nepgr_000890 [Nepenthes gracilis]|uniref:Uncharacterized protein n=1 Tax=Nepenthes gracilis TaxID=150966 RepID=A0AAD3P3K0_NEPGR|nr:hypothetical protein Nepgr_000890 [Nepenthes gracilis]
MGIMENWSNAISRSQSIRLGRSCSRRKGYDDDLRPKWKMFWRRIKSRKPRLFGSIRTPTPAPASYDADTYSMNFDSGLGPSEPENFPRSFSARFADPSRTARKNTLNLMDY